MARTAHRFHAKLVSHCGREDVATSIEQCSRELSVRADAGRGLQRVAASLYKSVWGEPALLH